MLDRTPDNVQLHATQVGDTVTVEVLRLVDHEWVAVQRWHLPCAAKCSAADRAERLIESAQARGWILPEVRWPKTKPDHTIARLQIRSWTDVLTTAHELQQEREAEMLRTETAWAMLLCEAADRSYLSAAKIARLIDMHPKTLAQIRLHPIVEGLRRDRTGTTNE